MYVRTPSYMRNFVGEHELNNRHKTLQKCPLAFEMRVDWEDFYGKKNPSMAQHE
jgi:hypothetical protein